MKIKFSNDVLPGLVVEFHELKSMPDGIYVQLWDDDDDFKLYLQVEGGKVFFLSIVEPRSIIFKGKESGTLEEADEALWSEKGYYYHFYSKLLPLESKIILPLN